MTPEQCIEARNKLGWSLDKLSGRTGLSTKAIEGFENGWCALLPIDLERIGFAFSVAGIRMDEQRGGE